MNGIDVSNWQKGINLAAVPSDFVIMKATEGTGYVSPDFARQYDQAKAAGKLLGIYHYSNGGDVNAELNHFLKTVGNRLGQAILVLDWEGQNNPTFGKNDMGWCKSFLDTLKNKTGVTGFLYISQSKMSAFGGLNYPLWIAQYASMNTVNGYQNKPWNEGAYTCAIRQYSSAGRLPGYSGNLDINKAYIDKAAWNKYASKKGQPAPSKPSKPAMATEAEIRNMPVNYLKKYVGIKEGSAEHLAILKVFNDSGLCSRYKMTAKDAWCATGVSAAFIATGLAQIFPCVECSVGNMIGLAQKAGIWVENDAHVPKVGDAITYDWNDSGAGDCTGWPDHVGLVSSVSGNNITVIEPNYNDSVGYRTITVNARYIRGYVTPKFSSMVGKIPSSGGSASTPAKKPISEIAKEVIAGKWGNGDARVAALTAAGYDAAAVQAEVNRQLGASSKKSVAEIAKEVIVGKWGNGDDRINRLKSAGYDPNAVQAEVNKQLGASSKSVNQIADEVIAGKWGNGDDRVKRLRSAGYDPNAVQAAVNAKMGGGKSINQIAKEVIRGDWGNGETRKQRLRAAGYDPTMVQNAVNRLM